MCLKLPRLFVMMHVPHAAHAPFLYADWPRSTATALRLAELHLEADLRASQAHAPSLPPRPASPGGHSRPAPNQAPAGRHLHGCAANLGLVRLATLVAPGGPGAPPEALDQTLDLHQTLRQHWAAGRLAERCRQHSAAAGHFEAIVRLCTESGDAPTAQQAGEVIEHVSAQADGPAEAAAREQASDAAPVDRATAGSQQMSDVGAEPASQAHGQAEAAARTLEGFSSVDRSHARATEVRVRAVGGGVESVISASEAAARLEALQLHALLEASPAPNVC